MSWIRPDHAGGWSVDASVTVPGWDRQGLERLVRYCARPPLSQERFGRLNQEQLVYHLRKPTADGRTELILTPLELLDHLAQLVTPPRVHKHRCCGVLAPNAKLRRAVIESAGPAGATLQLLQEASEKMGLEDVDLPDDRPTSRLGRAAARCWALLLTRYRFSGIAKRFNLRMPAPALPALRHFPADHCLRTGSAYGRAHPAAHRRAARTAGGVTGSVAAAVRARFQPGRWCGRVAGSGPDGRSRGRSLGLNPVHG